MFLKKKIDKHDYTEVDGAQVWLVSWNTPDGTRYDNPELVENRCVGKAFITEKDAKLFVENLESCAETLQSTYRLDIKIEHQK